MQTSRAASTIDQTAERRHRPTKYHAVFQHTYPEMADTENRRGNDSMNTLTDRIRAAREEAGLSQTEVARALRISASAVNQWEQGFSKNIKLDHFFALAHLLGQDPLWLATGKLHPQARQTAAKPPAPDYPSMTREERVLLHHVRQLPNALRQVLLRFLKGLTKIYASPDQPVT